MNYAKIIQQKIYDGITDPPVRAAIYARVSTDNEGQKESCDNQVELANNYALSHPAIKIIGTFVDDGISGKNDYNRPQYVALLNMIETDSIDLIITKSLSRLNRDQSNSLYLSKLLMEHNATILTLEDGQIHDFEDMGMQIVHTISYLFDEQYVRRQSINGRKTHELRCERKELSAKDVSYGYIWNKDTKEISINEEEARIIRKIFEDYVYMNKTPAEIERTLKSEGIHLNSTGVDKLIRNTRYIGFFYINKTTTILGTGSKKSIRVKKPKEEWILVQRPDLQIVDTDLFYMAQRIRECRTNKYLRPDKKVSQSYFQGRHKFASKIFCAECGKPYQFGYQDKNKSIGLYRVKMHSNCVNSHHRILETDMEEIVRQVLKTTLEKQHEVCDDLERILTECVLKIGNSAKSLSDLKDKRLSREQKINKLIDTLTEGGLPEKTKERIKSKINEIEAEIENLSLSIAEMEEATIDESYVQNRISSIRKAINELSQFTTIDRDRVLNYIERILIHQNGTIDVVLRSGNAITVTLDSDFIAEHADEADAVKMGVRDALCYKLVTYPLPPRRAPHRLRSDPASFVGST